MGRRWVERLAGHCAVVLIASVLLSIFSQMSAQRSAENVQVVVRCRPLNKQEIEDKAPPIARVDEGSKEVNLEVKSRNLTKTFTYDAVYGPAASQRDVYNGTVLPIVQEVLEGYNCTIFAYGQTGTGKTYTMEGNRDTEDTSGLDSKARLKASREAGVISRSINTIFEHLGKSTDEYTVKVSHLELYNEELYDLLDPENKGLKIFEDPANPTGSITVRGLTEINVYNPRDIFNVLEKSWKERTTAETVLNKESSRSHCIFSITIHMKERNVEGEDLLKVGKLNLVDLAGSENVGKSGMSAKVAGRQEAGMINKSLLAFGRVITALVDQSQHIPYRESKLTRLLQDSLGGRTKTCIIATISPASVSLDETIGTLEYAHRAKSIKNQPQVNAKLSKKEFLGDYAKEIDDIRNQLDAMRRKDGVYMPNDQYIQMTETLKAKTEEVEILLEEKKVKEKEFEEIHEVFDLQAKELKDTQSTLQDTQATLESTIQELNDTLSHLETARNDITEHKIILIERANNEAKFHQEAAVLLSTLTESIQDIEGLHAKIGREEELNALNNASWADLKDDVTLRLKKNETIVHEFVAKQAQRFREFDGSVHAHIISREGEVESLQKRLLDLNSLVLASKARVVDAIELYSKEAQISSSAIKVLETGLAEASAKQLNSFTESVDARVSTLANTIASYEQRTKTWSEAKENELKESVVVTHQFADAQKQKLEKFRTESNSQLEVEIANYAENRVKLSSFIEQQKAETREFQTKVLATVSVLLADFVARKEHSLEGALAGFVKNFDEHVDNLAAYSSKVNTTVTEVDANITSFEKEHNAKKASMIESVKKMSEITSGICKINTDQARSISTTAVSESAKIKDLQFAHVKSIEERLTAAQQALLKSAEEQKMMLEKFVEESASATAYLKKALDESFSSTKSQADQWSSDIKSRGEDADSFQSTWSSDLQSLSSKIAEFDLKRYNATGASPMKKTWTYPTELTHTRSEAEIIAQFRNGGEYVPIIDPLLEARKMAEASIKALKEPAPKEPEVEQTPVEEVAPKEEAPKPAEKAIDKPAATAAAAPQKPKALNPVNPATVVRANTKPINTSNILQNKAAPTKPGVYGRENPRPNQPAATTNTSTATNNNNAKPVLKRTNSQQQLVGSFSRKPGDITNAPSKQQ